MKKSNLFVSALTASMLLLAGCGEKAHEHVDTDPKDHKCDSCGEVLSQCVDENHDHNCDYCGKEMSQHVDTDPKDHICDYCGEKMSEHVDADPKDHVCDYCGEKMSEHVDTDPKDHICDYCDAVLSQHVDTDPKDLICDYCGAELDGIKEVKITSKRSYIGVGESFKMSGEALVSGAITNSAVIFSTDSTLVTLEQAQGSNEVTVTAGAEKGEAVIKATSIEDSSKEKEITISIEGWSATSKNRMSGTSGVLEGYNLPYYKTINGADLIKPTGATTVTGQVDLPDFEEAVQALVDGGFAKVEREEKVFYVMNHPTKFGFDVEVEIQGNSIDDPQAGYYNFIASLQPRELSEFPEEAVKAVVDAGTESEIPMPEDGTEFMILRNLGYLIEVKLNGDPAAFISSLESANYYINRDSSRTGYTSYALTCSPERTLLVHVSVADGYYTITYTNQTVPTKSAWTLNESNGMESAFGYVPPFVNVGLNWSSSNRILTTSRVEAYDMIVAAYKASSDFEWQATKVVDSQGNQYDAFLFSHALSEYMGVQILVYRIGAQTTIQPSKVTIMKDSWEADYVASFLPDAWETLPAPVGTKFGYNGVVGSPTFIQINVVGSMTDYLTGLQAAEYSITYDSDYDQYYIESPLTTIYGYVWATSDTSFSIQVASTLPAGYSYNVPEANITASLQLTDASSLVLPTDGTLFFFANADYCDVNLTVCEGGDMSAFITALGTAEFVETELDSGIYVKENVQITVTAGEGGVYTINYTLLVKPEKATAWNDADLGIFEDLFYYSYWGEPYPEVPFPTTLNSYEIYDNYNDIILVYGGNLEEFIGQLEQAGFVTQEAGSGLYYVFSDEEMSGYPMIVGFWDGNGTIVISGYWILG